MKPSKYTSNANNKKSTSAPASSPYSQKSSNSRPPSSTRWLRASFYWLVIAGLLAIGGFLLVSEETETLLRAQELNLWLPTRLFWEGRMVYPGGAASWLGCYFTQFFYHPWLGTLILCGLWLIICLLLAWVYRLRGPWLWLTLLVPMALLACFTETGYWIYYQKLQGHMFVPTVGVLFAVATLAIHRTISNHWSRMGWMALVCLVGYPLFGAWALGATGLLGLYSLFPPTALVAEDMSLDPTPTEGIKRRVFFLVLALILIAVIPQIYYQRCFEMTRRAFVYMAALPSFRYSADSFEQYRLPYYAIILAFVLLIIVSSMPRLFNQRLRGVLQFCLVGILLAIGAFGVSKAWYRDVNFYKELAMNRAIEECDWERVLDIAREPAEKKPTRQIVMYKNLALFRLGRCGDEMFLYPEGSEKQNVPWQVHMTQVGGKLIYYHYGKENFCYRWCMEDGVEFGWKLETLKLMARNSLLNHEWEVARKYLDLIRKTTFGREWADHYATFLTNRDGMDLQKVESAIKAGHPILSERDTEEFLPIMHMMTYPDRLDGDNTLVEMYLLNSFAKGNGDDPYFQEMTLICALIMKDIDLFWPRFMKFATMNPKIHMPRYYQEAAYLYGHLENKVDISRMPFDQSVKDTYDRFMQFNAQCGPMDDKQKAEAFAPMFSDTFYYFYFLVRGQKTN